MDKQLATVFSAINQSPEQAKRVSGAMKEQLRKLKGLVVKAARLLSNYCGEGFAVRFLKAGSDKAAFETLDKDIRDALQVGMPRSDGAGLSLMCLLTLVTIELVLQKHLGCFAREHSEHAELAQCQHHDSCYLDACAPSYLMHSCS